MATILLSNQERSAHMYKPMIYCSGPTAGLTFEVEDNWRQQTRNNLGEHFEILEPSCDTKCLIWYGENDTFFEGEQGIFYRDTHNIKRCDGILINLYDAAFISLSTPFEIGMGWALQKPMVVILQKYNPYHHAFVRQSATYITDNLEDAFLAIRSIFNRL